MSMKVVVGQATLEAFVERKPTETDLRLLENGIMKLLCDPVISGLDIVLLDFPGWDRATILGKCNHAIRFHFDHATSPKRDDHTVSSSRLLDESTDVYEAPICLEARAPHADDPRESFRYQFESWYIAILNQLSTHERIEMLRNKRKGRYYLDVCRLSLWHDDQKDADYLDLELSFQCAPSEIPRDS
jgi:hypothetical protein